MRSSAWPGLVLFLMLAVLGYGADQPADCDGSSFEGKHRVGDIAPDFSLPLLQNQGQKVRLSEISANHPVLLVFWATWCASCVSEIPLLNQWHQKYSPRGLQILAINVQESPGYLTRFMEDNPIEFPTLLDEEGEVSSLYGLVGIPSSVLLAKGGGIIYYGFGLPDNMDKLLAKQPS